MSKDNPNVEIRDSKFGKGLFAKERINKDEVIAVFDGEIIENQNASDLDKDFADHAVQIGPHLWQDSIGLGRYINHSCDPNVGWGESGTLIAMVPIEKDQELTLDYEMSERSDWRMDCLCGSPHCRKIIGSFDNLPEDKKVSMEDI